MERSLIEFPSEGITADTVQRAVDFVVMGKELIKRGEDMLKVYIKESGNVNLEGGEYGYYQKDSKVIPDVGEAYIKLFSSGVPEDEIWKAMTLAAGKAEKLAKKHDVDINGLVETKPMNKFGYVPEED